MRKIIPGMLLLASVLGCDPEIVGSATINGTYALTSVNGAALPYTSAQTSTTKTEIIDDTMILQQGNTYSETIHLRNTTNGTATTETRSDAGTFSSLGTSVTFNSSVTGAQRLAAYSANRITFVVSGVTSVFTK